jgi:hypothetical protein
MAHLIHNEQVKLMATFLNNCSVAVVAGGMLVPALIGRDFNLAEFAFSAIVGCVVGLIFHMGAFRHLYKLKEEAPTTKK